MEMSTVYIWGSIGALFCLVIGAMLGYARYEKQHTRWVSDSRKAFEDERVAIAEYWGSVLTQERNVVRELEISLLHAGQAIEAERNALVKMENQWKYADKYRYALVKFLVENNLWNFNYHANRPEDMINVIIDHAEKLALDPLTSKAAKNLVTRGVRKGAAKGRAQMAKAMQRSIDNQAETIQQAWTTISKKDNIISLQATEHELFREALRNTIEDKIALPSVRKGFKNALANEYTRLITNQTK